MHGRRVWPKPSKLSSLLESDTRATRTPHQFLTQHDSSSMLAAENVTVDSASMEAGSMTRSPENANSLLEGHDMERPAELLQEKSSVHTPFAHSPSQSIAVDLAAEQYDTLDDEGSRRAILAQKLQEVFGLPSAEAVLAEYPSWLFRSVLLQGFLYLTEAHLCFYAYIKGKEGQVIRSGTMYRRYPKSILQSKYWSILKDDVLSWYSSSTNPYFPIDHIPLHYVTSIVPSLTHEDRFKIITPNKVYRFATESAKSQQEWIKILRKVAFRSQNAEDSIKVSFRLCYIMTQY